MAFSAAVAFASLVRTSLMLSRSYVVLLPRYVNCLTFSKCLPSINNFPVGSFSPNTIVFVFSKFSCAKSEKTDRTPKSLIGQCPNSQSRALNCRCTRAHTSALRSRDLQSIENRCTNKIRSHTYSRLFIHVVCTVICHFWSVILN